MPWPKFTKVHSGNIQLVSNRIGLQSKAFETGLSVRKGIILFEAIGPFHVNFHHDEPSNTNFFSSLTMCKRLVNRKNAPSLFAMKCVFSLEARVAKNLPVGPSSFFLENGQQ